MALIMPSDSSIVFWVDYVAVAVKPSSGVLGNILAREPSFEYAGRKSFLFKTKNFTCKNEKVQ